MASYIERRKFLATLGGAAAAWPLAVRAQQLAMPVVGYLSARSAASDVPMLDPFRRGLNEAGYVEGQNLTICGTNPSSAARQRLPSSYGGLRPA
jgi:putative tryptophan/tyrosine transport system substrate-binding protein